MATAADIVRDISDFGDLLHKRGGNAELTTQLVTSLCSRISSIRVFGATHALALCNALDASNLPVAITPAILAVIDARTSSTLGSNIVVTAANTNVFQTMRHMNNFFTAADHAVFDDPRSSPTAIIGQVTSRLRRLGVKQPSHDGMLKWAMVIIVNAEWDKTQVWPTYRSLYNQFQDLNESMKAGRYIYPYGFIEHYPESPCQLEARAYDYAYDASDPPISKHISRYEMIGRHIPLRSNSKLLATEDGRHGGAAPAHGRHGGAAPAPSGAITWEQLANMQQLGMPGLPPGMAVRPVAPPPFGLRRSVAADKFAPKLRTIGFQLQLGDTPSASTDPLGSPPRADNRASPVESPVASPDTTMTDAGDTSAIIPDDIARDDAPPDDIADDIAPPAAAEPPVGTGDTALPSCSTLAVAEARVPMESYEEAAMNALLGRNKKRADEQKVKAKAKRASEKAAADAAKAASSVPAVIPAGVSPTAVPAMATIADHPSVVTGVKRRLRSKSSRVAGFTPPPIMFEEGDIARGRNCFTSKHYSRAGKAARIAGFTSSGSLDEIKIIQKAALKRASALWSATVASTQASTAIRSESD